AQCSWPCRSDDNGGALVGSAAETGAQIAPQATEMTPCARWKSFSAPLSVTRTSPPQLKLTLPSRVEACGFQTNVLFFSTRTSRIDSPESRGVMIGPSLP